MKNLIILIVLITTSLHLQAQYSPDWGYSAAEINFASKGSEILPSASINNFTNGQFKVGFAFRLNAFYSGKRRYITAPAILTSGKKGPAVLFADQIEENIDTIFFQKSQTYSVNVALLLEYGINNNWAAGFDIDLGGISYAPEQEGQYEDLQQQKVVAKSGLFNLMLISDNDIGNLNSELYLKYNLRWKIRGWSPADFINKMKKNLLLFIFAASFSGITTIKSR